MKARVRPVGARNVIGWPVMVAYAMPDSPHEPTVWGARGGGGGGERRRGAGSEREQ